MANLKTILPHAEATTSAAQNVSTPLVLVNASAPAPALKQNKTIKPAVPPSAYALFGMEGDGAFFGAGDSAWVYGDSKYAIPAIVIMVLLLFAGVGLFVVYWRRKRAANYYGLKEAELNSVQMHRS